MIQFCIHYNDAETKGKRTRKPKAQTKLVSQQTQQSLEHEQDMTYVYINLITQNYEQCGTKENLPKTEYVAP